MGLDHLNGKSEDIFTRAPKICLYVRNGTDSHSLRRLVLTSRQFSVFQRSFVDLQGQQLIEGRALDNVLTEWPWLTRKYEEVCLHDDATPKEERCGIDGYFNFYNHWRPHQSLVYQTHAEVCFQPATARQKQMAVIKSTLAAKGK